jgi:hypothetical protein
MTQIGLLFKNKSFVGVNRLATMAMLMFLTAIAVAEPLSTAEQTTASTVQPVNFSTVDLRKTKDSAENAQAKAEEISSLMNCPTGCLALLVFGHKNANFIQSVEKAASEAILAGVPVKGLIYANPISPKHTVSGLKTTTGNALIFYAAGTATSLFVNIRDDDSDAVFNLCQDEIRRAYTLMIDALKGLEPPPESN